MTLQERYRNAKIKEQEIQEEIAGILQEYADENCPYKIGDIITVKNIDIPQGRQGIVKKVYSIRCMGTKWEVFGEYMEKHPDFGTTYFRMSESDERDYNERHKL